MWNLYDSDSNLNSFCWFFAQLYRFVVVVAEPNLDLLGNKSIFIACFWYGSSSTCTLHSTHDLEWSKFSLLATAPADKPLLQCSIPILIKCNVEGYCRSMFFKIQAVTNWSLIFFVIILTPSVISQRSKCNHCLYGRQVAQRYLFPVVQNVFHM